MSGRAMARAEGGWPQGLPDWVRALAAAVDETTQGRVAARVGYSESVISEVISGRYAGNRARVEERVRAAIMGERVACPVLGGIARTQCFEHQARARAGVRSSEQRIRLSRACPACPEWRGGKA